MSRHGYSDDLDNTQLNVWRGAVKSAIRGRRGQAFLKELAAAMDAMPEKYLIEGELVSEDGDCCAIGVVCKARGIDVSEIDAYEPDDVADAVGIAEAMAQEIAYENDEGGWRETPEQRWERMRRWVAKNIKPEAVA